MTPHRFVLAVVADLGGRRDVPRQLARVDRDGFEDFLRRRGVELVVPDGRGRAPVAIERLDDFHPDAFADRVPGLAALVGAGGSGAVAPSMGTVPVPAVGDLVRGGMAAPPAARRASGGLLDAVLHATERQPARNAAIDAFARAVAEPATTRAGTARGGDRAALAVGVRAVLDDPRFRGVESAWRSLFALVACAETGPELEVRVLDVRRDEAAALLAEELARPGVPPPSVVLAAFRYGSGADDLHDLAALATAAARVRAPVVADASVALLALDDVRALGDPEVRARIGTGPGLDAWRAFRRSAAATQVCLCLPRVLLRLPYGPAGEPVERFAFDEALEPGDHERFCWGSAALALGRVLAAGFAAQGWGFDVAAHADLEGLPVHVFGDHVEPRVLPCAEVVMSEATIRRVMDEGLTVLASVRDEDRAGFWGIGTVAGGGLAVG